MIQRPGIFVSARAKCRCPTSPAYDTTRDFIRIVQELDGPLRQAIKNLERETGLESGLYRFRLCQMATSRFRE
jgi:hypothetical protein